MFLHPWAIAMGVVAAGLPVAIHFLTRPRPMRLPLSTLRFLREAIRQRRTVQRLRDWLILAARTLAILLIALAIARPRFGQEPLISDSQGGSAVRVVVLDVSQSMAATEGNVEAIERARTTASGYLRYRVGLQANLIVAGARSRAVFTQPSQNFEALRDELSRAEVLPQRLDVNRALAMAAEMLAPKSKTDDRRRELVVVSDFQRSNWASADFSMLPKDTKIQLESTAPDEPSQNLALLSAAVRGRSAKGQTVRLEVEVGNYCNTLRKVSVEVALGDAMVRLSGACLPGRRTKLSEEISLGKSGWQWGTARLVDVDDSLRADDQRAVVVEVHSRPVYAIITREPAALRPSSSYYLECALAPDRQRGQQAAAEVVRVSPTDMAAEMLTGADLIVLDHPGKLSSEAISSLAGLMRRGRSVVYVTAELVDATNLRLLVEAVGGGIQMPVEFSPPPRGRLRRDLFLTSWRGDVAPFNVFGESTSAIVNRLRFSGGLSSRRLSVGLEDDVVATYSDGTACLMITSSDNGSLAVINADLGLSTLPRTDAFVPLIDQLVQRLLQNQRPGKSAESGQPMVARLPASLKTASSLRIVGPSTGPQANRSSGAADDEEEEEEEEENTNRHGRLVEEGLGVLWRWQQAAEPGVYRVENDRDETVFCLAVGAPAEESQLDSLSADVLQSRLAGDRDIAFRSAADAEQSRDMWWNWLLAGCVVCLLGELSALLVFRS